VAQHSYCPIVGTNDEPERTTIRGDLDGLISYWGPGVEALLGHTPEQAIGQSLGLVIPKPLHPFHWRGFDKALRTGELHNPGSTAKVPAVHRDGTLRAVQGEIGLTRDENGTINGAEVANLRPDRAWKAAAYKPVVAILGLAGRVGLRPKPPHTDASESAAGY
jgi:PAS domain S-box-containing protein